VVVYRDDLLTDARIGEVARHFVAIGRAQAFNSFDVSVDVDAARVDEWSARRLAGRLGALLDRVAA
jgi:hypothetical protein